jgi:DNA-binding transcriptional regulator YhcF (GntR family)
MIKNRRARFRVRPLHRSGQPGPAGKQQAILEDLRRRIVTGVYQCGDRLPTRTQLRDAYDVSSLTIQWALDRLSEDGFVVAQGTRGTFVAQQPPHRVRVGLVLEFDPLTDGHGANALPGQLLKEFIKLGATRDDRFPVYRNVRLGDQGDWPRLREDLLAHRLAGVVCQSPFLPARGEFEALLRQTAAPCVAVASGDQPYDPNIKRLVADHRQILAAAMDELATRGRKHIGVLESSLGESNRVMVHQLARERKLNLRRCHLLAAPGDAPHLARPMMELLMQSRHEIDGLIIADDSLVEQATLGLVDAGAAVGAALDVVAHANFPEPSPAAVPAIRVGVDVAQAVAMAMEMIQGLRDGRTAAPLTRLNVITRA